MYPKFRAQFGPVPGVKANREMRVLLVEDDADLAARLIQRLRDEGFVVDHSVEGEEGLYLAETGKYAACIVDIGLPGLDGLVVVKRLRAQSNHTPTLLLTARDSWRDGVTGLRVGADDFLGKPFETEELLARLEALIRRSHGVSDSKPRFSDLVIDLSEHSIVRGGKEVHLTPGEYRVLAFLAVNRGTVVSKSDLAEQIWQEETDRELNAVEVVVGRIRKKIGTDAIQTKRGYGYVIPK